MNILLVASLSPSTGNNATISRIGSYLKEYTKGSVIQVAVSALASGDVSLARLCKQHNVHLLIGIHAYRAGRFLSNISLPAQPDQSIPYIIIFGGTDINEHVRDEQKKEDMDKALLHAARVVAFHEYLSERAKKFWPEISSKLVCIHPSVVVREPKEDTIAGAADRSMERLGIPFDCRLFVLVAGLRPVKDPCYLLDAFRTLVKTHMNVALLIVGPELDATTSKQVKEQAEEINRDRHGERKTVYLRVGTSGMEQEELHNLMKSSFTFALLNTSITEGLSNSILEAMLLRLPVLARRNPGNESLITHNQTGLLFSKPSQFVEEAKRLLEDEALYKKLQEEARSFAMKSFSRSNERSAYIDLVQPFSPV